LCTVYRMCGDRMSGLAPDVDRDLWITRAYRDGGVHEAGYGGQPDSQGPRRDGVGRHAALPERLQQVGAAQEGRPLVARVGGLGSNLA